MTFGEYIRERGYTAKSLAEQAGVNQRNLEHYTTGDRPLKNCTLEVASKIAKALDMRTDDLLDFDD